MKKKFIEAGQLTTGGIGDEEETVEKKPAFDLALVDSKKKTKKKTIGGTAPPPTAGDSEEEESSEEAECD